MLIENIIKRWLTKCQCWKDLFDKTGLQIPRGKKGLQKDAAFLVQVSIYANFYQFQFLQLTISSTSKFSLSKPTQVLK